MRHVIVMYSQEASHCCDKYNLRLWLLTTCAAVTVSPTHIPCFFLHT